MALPAAAVAPPGASGLPQFDLAQWPGEIVWLLIVFALLYLMFSRVFLPRVGGAMALREDKISGEIGAARRMRDEAMARSAEAAGEMAQARARARKLADEAIAQVKAEGQARRAQEDATLAEILAEAETQIASARTQAMVHVRSIARDAAGAMIQRLTGAPASSAELQTSLADQPGRGS
jgi:F-type H+-transporting ATPase subunit b